MPKDIKSRTKNIFDINGKVCIIAGGAGLIGTGFSRSCAERGAMVVIADFDEKKGKKLAEDLRQQTGNENVVYQPCDITKEADCRQMVESVLKQFGRIDGLVNCSFPRIDKWSDIPFSEIAYDDFCKNLNVHLGGYFLLTQKVAQVMQGNMGGVIVNIGSIYGFCAPKLDIYEGTGINPMNAAYFAIKAGILNLTKYWAVSLGKNDIRVNAISPGGVFDNHPEDFVKNYGKYVVLGQRMAGVDDLVGPLIFLLSDASKYVTGQNLIVDGGWSLL